MAELYRYAAFISYSSKDEAFCARLHRALESYAIPKSVGKFDLTGGGKRNRIYPVFRDREELPAGDLGDTLEAALRSSAALIVICSPDAAESPWVDKEIRYFKSLGREDRIFCIVPDAVPGEIGGKDAIYSCFPPSLATGADLPLAGDSRKGRDGFRNAWLKLVAGIVGVNAGSFADRDRARNRSRMAMAVAAVASAIAFPAAAVWAYVLPQETYAKSFVRVFGQPTPVDVLTKSAASKRQTAFRFVRNGYFGPDYRVEAVNGSGACSLEGGITSLTGDAFSFTCNDARACRIEVDYADGSVRAEKVFDQFDNLLEEIEYSDDGDQAIRSEAVRGCSRLDNGIKFIEVNRQEAEPGRGRDVELKFFRERGEPRANTDYVYGIQYLYDAAGRVMSRTNLGKDFKPARGKAGWARLSYLRNDAGDPVEYQYRDEKSELVSNDRGYARQTVEWSAAGNPEFVRNFLPTGRPAITKNGSHAWRNSFDERGNSIGTEYFDSALLPVEVSGGYHRSQSEFDNNGFTVGLLYFGPDGAAVPDANGCARHRLRRTATGEMTSTSCWDNEGKAAVRKDGYHEARYERDAFGNMTMSAYFGAAGEPGLSEGVHLIRYVWEDNRRVANRNFGPNGQPVADKDGRFEIRSNYNDSGFVVRQEHFDVSGMLTRDRDGAFVYAFERDERGGQLRQTPLGPDGEVLDLPGINFAYERDEFGREIRRWRLDVDGKRTEGKTGEAGWSTEYDVYGRIRRQTNLDVSGQLTMDEDGAAHVDREYDDRGFQIRTLYRNAKGELIPGNTNGAIIQREFDVRGNIVAYRTLGADGQPVLRPAGYSTEAVAVDVLGRVLEVRYLDVGGAPVLLKDGAHGWSNKYDDRGNRIELVYRGLSWEPKPRVTTGEVAIYRYTFDAQNRESSVLYSGIGGEPQELPDRGFGTAYERDERGDIKREITLGRDAKPAAGSNGIAITAYIRDAFGREIKYDYLDPAGALLVNDRAHTLVTYDRFGNVLERRFTDAEGNLFAAGGSGRAIVRNAYDRAGRLLSEVSLDANEAPVNRKDEGWHRRDRSYTPGGALINEVCTTTTGQEVAC